MFATTRADRIAARCTARCAPTKAGAISKGGPRAAVAATISKGGRAAASAISKGGPNAAISKGGRAAAISLRR